MAMKNKYTEVNHMKEFKQKIQAKHNRRSALQKQIPTKVKLPILNFRNV